MKCLVEVETGPEPRIRKTVCPKGQAALEKIRHPDRIKHPLQKIKSGNGYRWESISWEKALDLMARTIGKLGHLYGKEAVCSMCGDLHKENAATAACLFPLLGFPNVLDINHQCGTPGSIGEILTYGASVQGDTGPDYINSRCILIWGANPLATRVPQGKQILNARGKGAKLIVVDPRYSEMAKHADLWLRIRPGADLALVMSMINVIISENLYDRHFVATWCLGFEELKEEIKKYPPTEIAPGIWLKAEEIVKAGRIFAATKPASCHRRLGVAAQHINATQAGRAMAILTAITGNLDIPGGNLLPTYIGGFKDMKSLKKEFNALSDQKTMRLGSTEFPMVCGSSNVALSGHRSHTPTGIKAMLDGRLRSMVNFGSNMVVSEGNSREVAMALSSLDFLAVVDMFMTPTAELAHLVLPAAHWLETETPLSSFQGSYNNDVYAAPKVFAPPGECRDDRQIILDLSKKMKITLPWTTVEEINNYRTGDMGITFSELTTRKTVSFPVNYKKYEKKRFRTPSGKVELISPTLSKMNMDALPTFFEPPHSPFSTPGIFKRYPLVAAQYRVVEYEHSEGRQLQSLRDRVPDPLCEIHPDTARNCGIENGEWLYLETPAFDSGIRLKAQYVSELDPRVVGVPVGWWYPEEKDGLHGCFTSNINALIGNNPPYDPVAGQYQMRANLCRVSKWKAKN